MRKSFSLIEIVIVVSSIGMLAAIAIPKFLELRRGACAKTKTQNDRFRMTARFNDPGYNTPRIYTVEDKDTNNEYLVVATNDGVAITKIEKAAQ